MLKLDNIKKQYQIADTKIHALKGVSLEFRKSEFVSILGPSGCGKTTMLNIIGGLDRYTEGDLTINGISTKEYKDVDWDIYRNNSVGFVFQNYNLISHQTVLSNVELAMTLSGVSKSARRRKATELLERVGLGDQLKKKPTQLSGGQMQRVAIARALVNDPDILLADEPTGALDSETSVQIMELLKEIAKDKLIIMVTHNPELAQKYSTRIIRLLDGKVIDDTNPFNIGAVEKPKKKKRKKISMSFFTALALSMNNLLTKKVRTFMTAFAGSIGIIGIALILSLSSGMQIYINTVEEDTLSSYPIEIQSQYVDMTGIMNSMMATMQPVIEEQRDENAVYTRNIMREIMESLSMQAKYNDLKTFRETFNEAAQNELKDAINDIQYSYDLDLQIYKTDTSGGVFRVNPTEAFDSLGMTQSTSPMMGTPSNSMFSINPWRQLFTNESLLNSQYEVLAGTWPKDYNEVVLIVDKNHEVSDMLLYSIGVLDASEIEDMVKKLRNGEKLDDSDYVSKSYTFDELLDISFKLVLNTDYYVKNGNAWQDKTQDEAFLKDLVDNAPTIQVVGVVCPSENSSMIVSGGYIGYTHTLTEYVIQHVNDSEIAKQQLENPDVDVFTGIPFSSNDTIDFSNLTEEQKAAFAQMSEEELAAYIQSLAQAKEATYESNLEKLGIVDLDKPSMISIYPADFKGKEKIAQFISDYNAAQTDAGKPENTIEYSDIIGIMMSNVSMIINIITYVLIAFVGISLVVSSIMIGIITYISVLERTKEIGILRSIGASKRDISRVFNAETAIVGTVAGLLGIGITLILNIPINSIIFNLSGISGLSRLPFFGGVFLLALSVLLTMVAGLIPSKVAAKKDPVEALRSE